MNVQNKVIVVTGGGSGIGRELVLLLLSKGAQVAALDINHKTLEETANLAGDKKDQLSTYVVDITSKEAVEALPEKVIARHGAVDGIINNAGIIQPFVRIKDLEYSAIDRVMNVNFYGLLYMTKSFLPYLLERPEGHITNVSSMGGFLPVPGQSVYGAAKAAVKLFTEALYAELADTNVNVSVVFPGAIATNITSNSGLDNRAAAEDNGEQSASKAMDPAKAAQIIINGMEKNQYRIIVGSDSAMMDIMYRINSKFATDMITKQMASLLA